MTTITTTRIVRTFKRVPPRPLLGSREDEADVDVTSFNQEPRTIEFHVDDGSKASDPFHLSLKGWEAISRPDRITVTVEAA